MKSFSDKFSEMVSRAFESFSEPVDPNAWAAIEKQLRRKRRKKMLPFFVEGACISILLFLLLFFNQKPLLKNEGLTVNFLDIAAREMSMELPVYEEETNAEALEKNRPLEDSNPNELKNTDNRNSTIPHKKKKKTQALGSNNIGTHSLHLISAAEIGSSSEKVYFSETVPINVVAPLPMIVSSPESMFALPAQLEKTSLVSVGVPFVVKREKSNTSSNIFLSTGLYSNWYDFYPTSGLGLQLGGLLQLPISNSMDISSGLHLHRNTFSNDNNKGIRLDAAEASNTNPFGSSNGFQGISRQYWAMEVPLLLHLRKAGSKWMFTFGNSSLFYLSSNTSYDQFSWEFQEDGGGLGSGGEFVILQNRQQERETVFAENDFFRWAMLAVGYRAHKNWMIEPYVQFPLWQRSEPVRRPFMTGVRVNYKL